MSRTIDDLDTPQLLLDLDRLDENLARMRAGAERYGVALRVHFKSLKCSGLARYLMTKGVDRFLCAKLNEAEVLVAARVNDLFLANQVVGSIKRDRLAKLQNQAQLSVCVDATEHIDLLRQLPASRHRLGVFIEVNVGMDRCGIDTPEEARTLARQIAEVPHLQFQGIQAYDGHLQGQEDTPERAERCRGGLAKALAIRSTLEAAGFAVPTVTGAGTSTWETAAPVKGFTEIQPGSFLLMDGSYHRLRPEFAVSLTILATVISVRPGRYVLDVGSKGVSQDFTRSTLKNRPRDQVLKVNEEHTIVETKDPAVKIGDRVEIISGHCCATMNLHRTAIAVRNGRVEAEWPIDASGRYD